MIETDTAEILRGLLAEAERQFGAERVKELIPELEIMAEQLTALRSTPVELQDEP